MSELEKYLKVKEPKVSNVKARFEMTTEAEKYVNKVRPDLKKKTKKEIAELSYLNGMYAIFELIF